MIRSRIGQLVADAFDVDRSCRDKVVIERGMAAVRQLRAMLDAQKLVIADALSNVSLFAPVDRAEEFRTVPVRRVGC